MDLRHTRRDRPLELVGGNEETEAAVVGHITAHLGPVTSVYHEFLSDLVHIDVHVVPRPDCLTLVTCGMSDRAMTVPDGIESPVFAELPLHADELALKLAEGTDALIDRLDAAGIGPIVAPDRPGCV